MISSNLLRSLRQWWRSFLLLLEGHKEVVSRATGQQEGPVSSIRSFRTQTYISPLAPIPHFACMQTFQVNILYIYSN